MVNKNQKYLNDEKLDNDRIIRTEIILTPLLIVAPILIGVFLINDWYVRDFLDNELNLFRELLLGIIIIVGNILFDIPFVKSLKKYTKEKKLS